MIDRLKSYLSQSIDGRVLGLFRLFFGVLMALEIIYYIRVDLVRNMYVLPAVHFKYDGFGWVKVLPEPAMYGLVYSLLVLALMMAAGLWLRWTGKIFAVLYAYLFFIDKSIYNNHIYLYFLMGWLLSCTHAGQFFSLGKKRTVRNILRWEQFIFQFQFVIVYFYAAIVKLKGDWLFLQEPVRSLVAGLKPDSLLGAVFRNEFMIYVLNYGGLLLDLATPILLWYKPVRRWAIYPFMAFHLTNSQIFDDIGYFPFVMLAGLLVFYELPELPWLQRWVGQKGLTTQQVSAPGAVLPGNLTRSLFTGYFVFQLFFPLRGFLLPNQLDWTTIGNRFAWRVKGDSRGISELNYQVYYTNGQVVNVEVGTFVNTHQIKTLIIDPRAVRELAFAIKKAASEQGGAVASVKARIKLSCNGRSPQFFVDPDADLTKVKYSPFQKLDWVVDLD